MAFAHGQKGEPMRAIDGEMLYEKACDLEAQALAYVGKIANDESKIEEWRIWSAILIERTAFKHDIFDAHEVKPQHKKGKWIPVTRIEKWHKEEGLVGFPPEVKEFPQCTIKWVDATEPDEVDGLRCSECGTVYDFTEARNWCSECGAKMEGQDED